MTLEKSNAWKDSTAAGALLALLAAFGFSLKAIFVKLNLSEKDPELFRDQEKKKTAAGAPVVGNGAPGSP